jgi:hypothetical protein
VLPLSLCLPFFSGYDPYRVLRVKPFSQRHFLTATDLNLDDIRYKTLGAKRVHGNFNIRNENRIYDHDAILLEIC